MVRSEQYMVQHKIFVRRSLEGEQVIVTRSDSTTTYGHQEYTTVCIRWIGLHQVEFGVEQRLAQESMVFDGGSKLGITVVMTPPPDRPATQTEKLEGQAKIKAAAIA